MAGFLPGPHSDPSDPLVVRAYTLTIQAPEGSGSVWPEPGTYKYLEDTDAIIQASPDPGSRFLQWAGNQVNDQRNPSTTVTMDSDKTIQAVFAEEVTLTVLGSGGGNTNPAIGVYKYIKNETATIKAIPGEGWKFTEWTGDVPSNSDTLNVVMDTNKTICAVFLPTQPEKAGIHKLYFGTDTEKAYWNTGGIWTFFATPRHGQLKELDEDAHAQYLNNVRHDTTDRHTLGTVVPHDDHANLDNIGNNTHAEIDSHIGDTDNPHGVTASQVNALSKLSGDALPTAGSGYRGQFFTVLGTAGDIGPPEVPEVPDKLYYCRSTDGGTTYEWKEVSLI